MTGSRRPRVASGDGGDHPGSRWAHAPSARQRGAANRVRLTHTQTKSTLRLALVFIATAAVVAAAGAPRWVWLHLFLGGGVVLAISGASLMLTVTWSAAPAPPGPWVALQRACIAAGAAGLVAGREGGVAGGVLAAIGGLYLVGLVLLAVLLVVTVRRGVQRRFDVAVAHYLAAIVAGVAGSGLGVAMVLGELTGATRGAHLTVNLLGLVGLVVGGTLPFFVATVGRSRMSPRASARRLGFTLFWQVVSLLVAVVALLVDASTAAAIALAGYAAGIVLVLSALPWPNRRQLWWVGPRLIGLWAGGIWWVVAVAATAVDVAAERAVFGGRWLVVLVIAGYAQILWGSLAYLLPMLRGGGAERLREGFAATRSWIGLAAVNAAGLAAGIADSGAVVAALVAVWVLDGALRAGRTGTTLSS